MNYSVPNQKVVVCHKDQPTAKSNFHRQIMCNYWDEIEEAAKKLNGNAFKLWLYCARHANTYKFAYSPEDVKDRMGVSREGLRTAWKELEEKGYFIQTGANHYEFFHKEGGVV